MAKEILPLDQWSELPYTVPLKDMHSKLEAAKEAHIMSVLAAQGFDTKIPEGYKLRSKHRYGKISFGFMSERSAASSDGKLVFRPAKPKTV